MVRRAVTNSHPNVRTRPRKRGAGFAVIIIAVLAACIGAGPAEAGLSQDFAVFSDCPVNAPNVEICIVSKTTSGEFHLGSKTVPVNKTVTLQGGLASGKPPVLRTQQPVE